MTDRYCEALRSPCRRCGTVGDYRHDRRPGSDSNPVCRYVCAHGHWLFVRQPTGRPPAVSIRREGERLVAQSA